MGRRSGVVIILRRTSLTLQRQMTGKTKIILKRGIIVTFVVLIFILVSGYGPQPFRMLETAREEVRRFNINRASRGFLFKNGLHQLFIQKRNAASHI